MADDDLLSLAKDLEDAPAAAIPRVRKAVEVTARSIRDDWRQGSEATGLSGYTYSIDYDMLDEQSGVGAEIGPNLAKNQGSFGFVEDAPGDVRSRPQHAGRDALEANQADFERGLAIAIWDTVLGRKSRLP